MLDRNLKVWIVEKYLKYAPGLGIKVIYASLFRAFNSFRLAIICVYHTALEKRQNECKRVHNLTPTTHTLSYPQTQGGELISSKL